MACLWRAAMLGGVGDNNEQETDGWL